MFDNFRETERWEWVKRQSSHRVDWRRNLLLGVCVGLITYAIRASVGDASEATTDLIWGLTAVAVSFLLVRVVEPWAQYSRAPRRLAEERADNLTEQLIARDAEIAGLRASLDERGAHKELRVESDATMFVKDSKDGSVYAVLLGVTVSNPNLFIVDVEPTLSISVGFRVSSKAVAWPLSLVAEPVTPKGEHQLERQIGRLVEIPPGRTIRGYVMFPINFLMVQMIRRFKPAAAIQFFLTMRDKNTNVIGERLIVIQRLSHDALMDLAMPPVSPSGLSPHDKVYVSSDNTHRMDDRKSE